MIDGPTYLTPEESEDFCERLRDAPQWAGWIGFTSITGQSAFPPEQVWVRMDRVESVQECSRESWLWQQEADARFYANALQDSAQERLADAQGRLVEFLSGADDE